ncbi:methylmalonyl-CoA mutase cobalamin-binding subunit [Streptomyces tendae]|uniref:aspartate/glutamate racemase family protein n=1 Tax=Streptomyces tendae TaxID=1932 RepID=UPI00383399E1
MSIAPKIALISAVPSAIPAAQTALRDSLPDAVVWNILDDRLLLEADSRGGLDAGLRRRMQRLIEHALAEDADAVLLTCSLYGPVAQATHVGVPVMAPDEAAFTDITTAGYASVLVVASFDAARDDSVERLKTALRDAGADSRVAGLSVPAAMAATKAGDHDALVAALVDACTDLPADVEAVFLAQYSLAAAGNALHEAVGLPVISGPKSAAAALLRHMSERNDR